MLTCIVLTYNSGNTIKRCLESIQGCDEILVLDGGSTDQTLDIATEYGARIVPQPQSGPITDFSAVRNLGLREATHPWILNLDSDEWASEELMEEIREIMTSFDTNHPHNVTLSDPAQRDCIEGRHCADGSLRMTNRMAYQIPRKYVLDDGTIVEHASTYPNRRMYFFHRDAVEEWVKPVHERPRTKFNKIVKNLTGATLAPIGTVEDFKQKNQRYLDIEKQKSLSYGWGHWITHRLLRFLRSRTSATLRILWIWLIPWKGKRLPINHEMVRYWYAWKLLWITCPLRR